MGFLGLRASARFDGEVGDEEEDVEEDDDDRDLALADVPFPFLGRGSSICFPRSTLLSELEDLLRLRYLERYFGSVLD